MSGGDPTFARRDRWLARSVVERAVSAAEVIAATLERIEATRATVNAVVQADGERAIATAEALDARLARGEPARPLEGVPFTAKDNLEAAGLPMAIGVAERRDVVPDRDATAVARLRAAGAILVGKTNCPPFGGGIETDNAVYGRTSNPLRPRAHAGRAAAAARRQRSPPAARRWASAPTRAPAPGSRPTSAGSRRSSRRRGSCRSRA